MNKKFSLKLSISFISIIALLVAAFILKIVILKPRPINKIEFFQSYYVVIGHYVSLSGDMSDAAKSYSFRSKMIRFIALL